jgi:hypothetical protein
VRRLGIRRRAHTSNAGGVAPVIGPLGQAAPPRSS